MLVNDKEKNTGKKKSCPLKYDEGVEYNLSNPVLLI